MWRESEGKRGRECFLVSLPLLLRTLILTDKASVLWSYLTLVISLKALSTTWRPGLQNMNFGGHITQYITGTHPKVIKILCNSANLYLNCLGTKLVGLVVTPTYNRTSWVSITSCIKGRSVCCWNSTGTSGSPREPLGWRNDIGVLSLSISSLPQKARITVAGPEAPLFLGWADCLLQGLYFYHFMNSRDSKPP